MKSIEDSDLHRLFSGFTFHPVIHLPEKYEIFDFTRSYDPKRMLAFDYGIGRYDERRAGMYTTELFTGDAGNIRDVHMGIDIGAPVGTPVHAFEAGKVFCAGINPGAGDYGGTLITEHDLPGLRFWVLHGHLSHVSVQGKQAGDSFKKGDLIAWVGNSDENGGWNPHLHFQLSLVEPVVCDMPGAVSVSDRKKGLETYPDPRLVLGKLY